MEIIKTVNNVVALTALVLAFVAATTMLYRQGRPNAKPGKASLWLHRVAGYGAAALFLLMMAGMIARTAMTGASFGARGAWHAGAGLALGAVILAKWAVVRPYRNLMKLAPALGVTLFTVAFVTVNLTATMNLMGKLAPRATSPVSEKVISSEAVTAPGDEAPAAYVAAHRAITAEKCGRCHHLKLVFNRERSAGEWEAVVARMRGYDAAWINDGDAGSIRVYLTGDYGP